MNRRWFPPLAALAVAFFATSIAAQQTGVVSGAVRTATGDSLPGAPVHVTATGVDTTVRANARGRYEIVLPFGTATLRATSIGYAPKSESVVVNRAAIQLDLVMSRAAQQLGGVDVNAKWTGVHGGVGDAETRAPLPGVRVTSLRQKLHTKTDSNGRFEIGMTKGERTLFQLSRDGYKTVSVSLDIADGESKDVVYFMKPGMDARYMKSVLNDLAHRAATTQIHGFMDDHEHLARHNPTNLLEAITESGLLVKKGLKMDSCIFLFIDGQPRYGTPVSAVSMANVDFVEVYEFEETLWQEWGVKRPCTQNPDILSTGRWARAQFVSVWMKH